MIDSSTQSHDRGARFPLSIQLSKCDTTVKRATVIAPSIYLRLGSLSAYCQSKRWSTLPVEYTRWRSRWSGMKALLEVGMAKFHAMEALFAPDAFSYCRWLAEPKN